MASAAFSVRGIVRGGLTLASVSFIHDLDLSIGPGLGLYPPGLSRTSRCIFVPLMAIITTSGPLAPTGIVFVEGAHPLAYQEDDFP